jgi:hypothetical protein
MLPTPESKPSTLRLTNIKEKVKNAPKAAAKAFEPVMTKKQRQRQAKAAEQKQLVEESNKQHEAKKQEQLRSARMATGTSNQIKAATFEKQNVWQSGKPTTAKTEENASGTQTAPLLDTLDKAETATPSFHSAVTTGPLADITTSVQENANVNQVRQEEGEDKTSALAASGRERASRPSIASQASWADEVNEEEQDKWASTLAQEAEWESVTTKKNKKKANKNNETSSEASSSVVRPTPATAKPVTNGTKSNGVQHNNNSGSTNRFANFQQLEQSSLKDAEWEA